MAKQLKDILSGVKSSKKVPNTLGTNPGVDYKPKSPDEQEWVKTSGPIEKHSDRVGNGDDIYQATNIKISLVNPEEDRHGYVKPEDMKVYESAAIEETAVDRDHRENLIGIHARASTAINNTPKDYKFEDMHRIVDAELNARTKLKKMGHTVEKPDHPQVIESKEVSCNKTSVGVKCPQHGLRECSLSEKYIGFTNLKRKLGKEDLSELGEARKLEGTYNHSNGNQSKVYKLSGAHDEGDPYHVKLFKGGKHYEPADYFTNDKEDAHGTAKHMVKEEAKEAKPGLYANIHAKKKRNDVNKPPFEGPYTAYDNTKNPAKRVKDLMRAARDASKKNKTPGRDA